MQLPEAVGDWVYDFCGFVAFHATSWFCGRKIANSCSVDINNVVSPSHFGGFVILQCWKELLTNQYVDMWLYPQKVAWSPRHAALPELEELEQEPSKQVWHHLCDVSCDCFTLFRTKYVVWTKVGLRLVPWSSVGQLRFHEDS